MADIFVKKIHQMSYRHHHVALCRVCRDYGKNRRLWFEENKPFALLLKKIAAAAAYRQIGYAPAGSLRLMDKRHSMFFSPSEKPNASPHYQFLHLQQNSLVKASATMFPAPAGCSPAVSAATVRPKTPLHDQDQKSSTCRRKKLKFFHRARRRIKSGAAADLRHGTAPRNAFSGIRSGMFGGSSLITGMVNIHGWAEQPYHRRLNRTSNL